VEAQVNGAKRKIGVNCRYLQTMLQCYGGGTIELRYRDVADPLLLTVAGSDMGLQILMPMRAPGVDQLDEAA
jgi:DNA polymerase III sliding clamp (beta) subunit (PCNA family)